MHSDWTGAFWLGGKRARRRLRPVDGRKSRGARQMKVVVSEVLTLDGVMQAPGGKDEDTSGGFQHGGWQLDNNYVDDVAGQAIMTSLENAEGLLLGRRTYEIFA